ncbi:LINE-1 retrotransposable element ORF2 protein [Elysia marginata]|uniref:LINE-1 retrotransposable element ORF2 protein n=1 Tax=Elysia marginata TaxID=1093978 RepID=A0AAV4JBW9_9GAST|nr:LINE-1 retrotransposable element ORF2 protein [Elysia marginata]
MKRNFAGPPIIKDEVRAAIRKMKAGKATGPDGVAVEMIEALEEYGVEKLTSLLNEIYDTGEIPTDISRSVFIALPKKPGATECELHRTISLMSHET